jgi:hypothetical protein
LTLFAVGARAGRPLAVRVGRRSIHGSLHEVRPALGGTCHGLIAPPLLDGAVVATDEDVWDSLALELRRARVLGILEQPVGERFIDYRSRLDGAR